MTRELTYVEGIFLAAVKATQDKPHVELVPDKTGVLLGLRQAGLVKSGRITPLGEEALAAYAEGNRQARGA